MKPSNTTYHLPILSRYDFGLFRSAGPGLGNLLFPISRALIGAQDEHGVFVSPTIRQIKLGPIVRREADKRIYSKIIKHRSVKDWKNRLKTYTLPHYPEGSPPKNIDNQVITYTGLRHYFYDLQNHGDLIRDWVFKNAVQKDSKSSKYDIAVHIRWGDFQPYKAGSSAGSMQQPLEWYRAAIAHATELRGLETPKIVIFTDIQSNSFDSFKDLGTIELDKSSNALTALMRMSCADLIIASRSTFSMWGGFLGDCDIVWDAQFDYSAYWPDRGDADIKFSLA